MQTNQLYCYYLRRIITRIIIERKNTFAPLSVLDSNPAIFAVLLYTCNLDDMLNSSSLLRYLAMTLQTNISSFLPYFRFGITKNKHCPWTSLTGTSHYPDGSQTSGTWPLGTHLTDKEFSPWCPAPNAETSEWNRPGRNVADIKANCFHTRWYPSYFKHKTPSSSFSLYSGTGLER